MASHLSWLSQDVQSTGSPLPHRRPTPESVFRIGFGLSLALLIITLIAATPALAEIHPFEVQEYRKDSGVSTAAAEADLELQQDGLNVVEKLEDTLGSRYAGVWFDDELGEFIVPIASSSETARGAVDRTLSKLHLGDAYHVRVVQNSWTSLEAAQAQLDSTLRSYFESQLVQTSLDPRTNAVVVHVASDVNMENRSALMGLVKHARVSAEMRDGNADLFHVQPTSCSSSNIAPNCSRPLRGGVEIGPHNAAYGNCTAGFRAVGNANGQRYLISAGHCAAELNPSNPITYWDAWDQQNLPFRGEAHYMGQLEQYAFPEHDWMKINVTGSWWDTAPAPVQVAYWGQSLAPPAIAEEYPINGEAASYVGMGVCHSGIASGGSCGQVANVHVTTDFGVKGGPKTYGLTEVIGACNGGGDSGGPWFASNIAYGIHLGSNAVFGGCVNRTYYAEITEATAALGVHIAPVPAPTMDPPILGEDDDFPAPHATGAANGAVDVFYRAVGGGLGHAWSQGGDWSEEAFAGISLSAGTVPHAVVRSDGTVDVFWRTPTGGLGHAWDDPGGWHTETLPGSVASNPHAAEQPGGTIDVLYRTPSGGLGHNWYQPGGEWHSNTLPGSVASDPYLVAHSGSTVDAFWRTPSGTLGHAWTQGGTWSEEDLPASLAATAAPHPVTQTSGTVDVFWRTSSGGMGHAWDDAGGWHTDTLAGWVVSEPNAVAQPGGTIDVFWRNGYGELGHDWYQPGNQWTGNMLTSSVAGDPYAVTQVSGTVDVFWRTTSGELGHAWDDQNGWHVANLPGSVAPGSVPHAVAQPNGTIDLFYRTPSGHLGHNWYQAGSEWHSETLPGLVASEVPKATTEAATEVKAASATLNAAINPEGSETTYQFEYGKTTSYGSKIPSTPKVIGSGASNVATNEPISGLQAGTIYHYRVLATNQEGTVSGEDKTLMTLGDWTIQPTPNWPGSSPKNELTGISCTSATACVASAIVTFGGVSFTYGETWNGTSWQLTPAVPGNTATRFNGISCSSATSCTAVGSLAGSSETVTFAAKWNGSQWTIQPTPNWPGSSPKNELTGISCTSATACVASAIVTFGGVSFTYGETWNGTSWQLTPAVPGNTATRFNGISCSSATSCTAVGSLAGASETVTFAAKWNGSQWTIQPTPNWPGSSPKNELTGISCTSATACVASAIVTFGGVSFTYGETWNGTSWQLTPAVPGNTATRFNGISCSSATSCTAVGSLAGASETVTFAAKWNGSQWLSQAPSNESGFSGHQLLGVSCLSSCTAVGSHISGNVVSNFAERSP